MAQVKVDGDWLATIGAWGGLKWSSVADGGSEQASWSMNLPRASLHPSLHLGKVVQIKAGSANIWSGILQEPNLTDGGWEFTAIGLADEGHGYLCLDSGGNSTSTPDVAIDQAIVRGLPWTRPGTLSNVPFAAGGTTDGLNYLGDLLDAWATSVSKRWAVNANGEVYAYTDPTTPTWYLMPGATQIGLADDDYASDLYLRYKTSSTAYATVHVADASASATRRREYPVDVTSLGVSTSGAVTAIGNGMLAKGKARYSWTDGVAVARSQITTPGGTPAYLPFVKAGDTVRSFGVVNEQGGVTSYVDWVIGRVEYEDGAGEISLAPTNLASRNLGDVLSLAVSS